MKHLHALVFLSIVAAHLPAYAASIFVAPVSGGDDAATAITRAVETAVLQKIVGADVVTPKALDTKLEVDLVKACNGTGDDAACVVDFAQGMGVDYVVRTQLSRLADVHIVTLSIYHGHRAALLGQGQRKSEKLEDLVDQIPALVGEVAKASQLSVVVERVKAPPYVAYGEIGGGVAVFAASLAVHGFALLAAEPAYEKASYDRDGDRAWEFARPFAYVVPVIGYVAGVALAGAGVYTLTKADP